ncbi:MAG: hypothetical protein A3J48_02710 [Candidatus Doudnabacteria bacterium RIFCSPHIGHO2_02_FULL_46_11]|uniref:Putative membrane protein insertion efficiency factor n=1 Tax=Candidatus Doudnabacteria bacterium RIFCSPHIGHO2_02_FULL_46_11 TaxID=1817832 RepID=A0A1F5P850_9BACT|nr:MAG: hypothetical protein A3J48_02710 [Candidatus Doudnabacteria bacterium RIFCSPHIGHO2_02_FULL_46_11]
MTNATIFLINIYQKTLSPDHSWLSEFFPYGFCRYTPSCSEYCKQSLRERGLFKGLALTFWRLLRCNPWARFGHDPVTPIINNQETRNKQNPIINI